jgi:hypothetical protein
VDRYTLRGALRDADIDVYEFLKAAQGICVMSNGTIDELRKGWPFAEKPKDYSSSGKV